MEQFSLEKWLQDKSRKVVTRDGRKVNILKYDAITPMYPVIASIIREDGVEVPATYTKEGHDNVECLMHYEKNDLFFADEEEELTEFEKAIYQHICTIVTACDGEVYGDKELKPIVKEIAKELLDLARKELQITDYLNGYAQGKQDTLKTTLESLPKWKKANVFVSNEFGLATRDDDLIITCNGYQIKLSDLKALPKEE